MSWSEDQVSVEVLFEELVTLFANLSISPRSPSRLPNAPNDNDQQVQPCTPAHLTTLPFELVLQILKHTDRRTFKALRLILRDARIQEKLRSELFQIVLFDPTQFAYFKDAISDPRLVATAHTISFREPIWGLRPDQDYAAVDVTTLFGQSVPIAAAQMTAIYKYYTDVVEPAGKNNNTLLRLKNHSNLGRPACVGCGLRSLPCPCGFSRQHLHPDSLLSLSTEITHLDLGGPVWPADAEAESARELNAQYRQILVHFVRSFWFPATKSNARTIVQKLLTEAIKKCPRLQTFVFNPWDRGSIWPLFSDQRTLKHAAEEDHYGVDIWRVIQLRNDLATTGDGMSAWVNVLRDILWLTNITEKPPPTVSYSFAARGLRWTCPSGPMVGVLTRESPVFRNLRRLSLEFTRLTPLEVEVPFALLMAQLHNLEIFEITCINESPVSNFGVLFRSIQGVRTLRQLHLTNVAFGRVRFDLNQTNPIGAQSAQQVLTQVFGGSGLIDSHAISISTPRVTRSTLCDMVSKLPNLRHLIFVNCDSLDATWPEQFDLFAQHPRVILHSLIVDHCRGGSGYEPYHLANRDKKVVIEYINVKDSNAMDVSDGT